MTANSVWDKANGSPVELFEKIRAEGRGDIPTIQLPWLSLNRVIGYGLKCGCVGILAGSPGASKSLMVANICLHAESQGFAWKYAPLEDEAQDWIERFMAVHLRDWKMISNPESDTPDARERLAQHKEMFLSSELDMLGKLYEHILENPNLADLRSEENPVDYPAVLDWIVEACKDNDLIVIDPVGFIEFSESGKDWFGQQRFIRRLTAIAKQHKVYVLMVAHTAKRPGRSGMLSTLDDLQGAAALSRGAHYVFFVDRHEEQESKVYSYCETTVFHKLTVTVGKSRGGFSGTRLAFDLEQEGPVFREYGIIKPRSSEKAHNG
jgi:hypothetical protein